MVDVSSRKPRPVSQLVAQQVNQQFAPPSHSKKDKKEKSEKDRGDKEPTLKRKSNKKIRYFFFICLSFMHLLTGKIVECVFQVLTVYTWNVIRLISSVCCNKVMCLLKVRSQIHCNWTFFFIPRPRLKNIDRSSAQHLEVTVGDLTVIITDFKEKVRPMSTSTSAASADQHSQSSSSDNTE